MQDQIKILLQNEPHISFSARSLDIKKEMLLSKDRF